MGRQRASAGDFWSQVDPTGACWLWTGQRYARGYGRYPHPQTHVWGYAHRLAYELTHGPIPGGLVVRHKCDNPPCVNPQHLELGTQLDNIADRDRRGRTARGDQHGSRNHPERFAITREPELRLGRAVLTMDQVREARRRHGAGETYAVIARALGVTPKTIGNLCRGTTWAFVQQG